MTARRELADLASAVEGVKVQPFHSQTLRTGQGYVGWAGRELSDDGFGYIETWQVCVALPKEVAKAEEWIDTRLVPLLAAIDTDPHFWVVRAVPADLVLGSASTNGLVIEVEHPTTKEY